MVLDITFKKSLTNSSTCKYFLVIECAEPHKIQRTIMTGSGNTTGSTRTYKCDVGYVVDLTQNVSYCQNNGQWSPIILNCSGKYHY